MIKFLGLGKKKEPEKMKLVGKGFLPLDKVKDLSGKGFSEPEIIDVLRKEGFSAEEIDRALTQALKIGVTGEEPTQGIPTLRELQSQSVPSFEEPAYSSEYPLQPEYPPQPETEFPQQMQYPTEGYPAEGYSPEELVESIVQERMVELDEKLKEFREKHTNLERKIMDIHNTLSMLSKERSQRDDALIDKLDSMKENLLDIEAKISSLEKTFKDALPALIESVRALTDLVQRFKKEA